MLLEKLQGMQVLTDVASGQQIHSPHVVVEVDRNLASSLNVPVASVDAALQNAFGQAQIGNYLSADPAGVSHPRGREEISIRAAGSLEPLRHQCDRRAGPAVGRHRTSRARSSR